MRNWSSKKARSHAKGAKGKADGGMRKTRWSGGAANNQQSEISNQKSEIRKGMSHATDAKDAE